MMQTVSKSSVRVILALIIIAYLIVGVCYAVYTPAWQTPDEPAHYNYIKYIADNGKLPKLRMGDYPHDYLEEIKARRFPPDMPINRIRYEFHQPPLYYLLATPLFLLTRGMALPQQVIILRCFSLIFGAVLIYVAHRTVREISLPYEGREVIALATAAFLAVVPMHIAMNAAINNDALAELFVGLILWRLMVYLRDDEHEPRSLIIIGALVGIGFLVKTTLYIIAGVALIAIFIKHQSRFTLHASRLAFYLIPIILISTPWFIRNAVVYGNYDFFGWQRHDAIVVGQLQTTEAIARFGVSKILRDFFRVSFHSFWAQFGWMGVPVDGRIYLALFVLCSIVVLGLVLFTARHRQSVWRNSHLAIMALTALLVAASHVWYNLKFLQHQGRYLFPAIVPLGFCFAVGLWEAWRYESAKWVIRLLLVGMLMTLLQGLISRDLNKWAVLIWGAFFVLWDANAIWVKLRGGQGEKMWRVVPFTLIYTGLYVLDFICLFKFIVPAL